MNINYLFTLAAFFMLFAACTDSKTKLFKQIKEMEQSDAMGTPEGLAKLAELHKEYGLKYKDSIANNYLYASAMYYYYGEQKELSKPLLLNYLERDDSSERYKNALLNLAQIYMKEEKFDSMDYCVEIAISDFLPNNTQWNELLNTYTDKINSGTEVNPGDFEKQALAFTALGMYDKATESLDTAISQYKNYENRPNMIYRAGFISWEYMKDAGKARVYYDLFLKEYPDHPLAKEVSKILESGMLEMSDEEILDMLKGNSEQG